jgi:general secretion pathway protein F
MTILVTPGQFTRRAEFHHQLAQLTSAGLGVVGALEELKRNPPGRSFRQPIQRVLDQLGAGYTFTESVRRAGQWLPTFDTALLEAGERSGRMDACFKLLADYYDDRARLARQMISDLAYPAFLLHFAIFIFPFAQFFLSGNLAVYLGQTLGVLIPIYAAVALLIYAVQSRHAEAWRAGMEVVLDPIPVLGKARRYLALSRLAAALGALLGAGAGVIEAWELAATASGSPALRRAVLAWKPRVLAGQTPAEAVGRNAKFPELFANLYHSGEVSGKLDESLERLHEYYRDEGTRKLHALAQWTPRMIYLVVALMIAYRVIRFWTGYFQEIEKAGGF